MYQDTPEENIYDSFYSRFFENHPLATNILGTTETVNSFTPKALTSFTTNYYGSANGVLSIVGSLPPDKVMRQVTRLFEKYATSRACPT